MWQELIHAESRYPRGANPRALQSTGLPDRAAVILTWAAGRKFSRCVICDITFVTSTRWPAKHCSKGCLTKHNTERHRRYVARNRERWNEYANARRHRIWGASSPAIAKRAEMLAFSGILPNLGFTELYDVTSIRRIFPFDVIGTYGGERVVVDVTTSVGKSGPAYKSAIGLIDALRLKLFVLFVKPDLSAYALKPANGVHGLHCSQRDLVAIG